jgi:hypothetical protein
MPASATYQILNGDCLVEQLKATSIQSNYIVCRECLIDMSFDPVPGLNFWDSRADYMIQQYHLARADYFRMTVNELKRIEEIQAGAEVCLWFEDDLFCQVNMWFVLSLIPKDIELKISRVFPNVPDEVRWRGFAACSPETLEHCYAERVSFETSDIRLGEQLWRAYHRAEVEQLKKLAISKSKCFRSLEEVCQAHIDRFPADGSPGRPERALQEIMLKSKQADFADVFREFSTREGIYGFGDLQIRPLYDKLLNLGRRP